MTAPAYAPNATPSCPDCGGPMYDERKSKFYDPSKNRPIFKCKNKGVCDGAIWPPRQPPATAPAPAPAPARNGRVAVSAGGTLPYETADSGASPMIPEPPTPVTAKLDAEGIRRTFAADYVWAMDLLRDIHEQHAVPLDAGTVYKAAYSVWSERLRRGAY